MRHWNKSVRSLPAVLLLVLASLGAQGAVAAPPAGPALVRIDVDRALEELGVPILAHLQGAAGEEYALAVLAVSEVEAAGLSYTVLDPEAADAGYLIALGHRPGARADAARNLDVLLDDGQRVVVRAGAGRGELLGALGFGLSPLPARPLVLRAPPPSAVARPVTYDPEVAAMIDEVRKAFVYDYCGSLTGEQAVRIAGSEHVLDTRATDSGTPIEMATQYVYEHLEALGLTVKYGPWTHEEHTGRNVIGELYGTTQPDEVVLVTAHLDNVPSFGRAPGADDNASGSVAVMIASRLMSQRSFVRTVRFIFFTGEEQGLLGARYYAAEMVRTDENVVAVFNLDMIGYDYLGGPVLRLHTRPPSNPGYPADLAIAELFNDVVSAYGLAGSLTPIVTASGILGSDHSPFWNEGYPGILAIEDNADDFNRFYHTTEDLRENLNLPYFTDYVRAAVGTAAHLAVFPGSVTDVDLVRPTQMRATVLSPSRVGLDWTDRSENESSFELYFWSPPGPWQRAASVRADVESLVVSGLTPGNTYWFRVRGRWAEAVSGWSNRAIFTLPVVMRPTDFRARVASPTQVRLDWTDRSDGEATSEVHLRSESGRWTPAVTVRAGVDRVVISGLTPGGTYYFRVRARQGDAVSDWSLRASATLPGGD